MGGGSALVLIRRWVPAKFTGWNAWDIKWELQQFRRLIRRDRRWCVELYYGITQDPGGTPSSEPDRRWIRPDRQDAVALGNSLSEHLASHGTEDGLPAP